jgi:myo-inositol-1(or 4)-monophosphatase
MSFETMDDEKILKTAKEAALEAGKLLETADRQRTVEFKGEVDLVTEYDRRSQEIIQKLLESRFPDHSILAEEDLNIAKDKELLWVIDPIDGTTNFAHSLPLFCVSIAFMVQGKTRAGVIYVPPLKEMFSVIRGKGAFLNDNPLRVSTEKKPGNSLLTTGFPYDRKQKIDIYIKPFKRFVMSSRGVRRMGSAAIDLAYTAAGRYEGFWEYNLHPWDTAAGFLMVQEAGGIVTDFSGNDFDPWMREVLASNGHIHPFMLDVLNRD